MSDGQYGITPVSASNAAHVATVFRSVYGDSFPVSYVYHPELIMEEIDAGRLAASLALDGTGAPIGYVSAFRCAPNPLLWEGGNLVVVPGSDDGELAWTLLQHYLQPGMLPGPPGDGIFGEAVCHHYFTQLGCSKAGFFDCAIALDQLNAASFTEHRPDTERVACLLQFLEYAPLNGPVYLPGRYSAIIRRLCAPLQPRSFQVSSQPLPASGETVREEAYFASAGTWRISISSIGGPWSSQLVELRAEARTRGVTSLQVVLSTAMPYVGAAVEQMRSHGFFLGGIFPRWFGADGILMQLVLGREPEYDGIKLYTATARELLAFIRQDRESLRGTDIC